MKKKLLPRRRTHRKPPLNQRGVRQEYKQCKKMCFLFEDEVECQKKCLKIFPVFKSCLETVFPLSLLLLILGDPGAGSGGGEKSKRVRKKFGPRKSRNERRAPWDKRFRTAQFQTVGEVLASGWCQKSFVFCLPNHRAARVGVVLCVLTRKIHTGQLIAILAWVVRRGFTRGEKFQFTAQNVGKIVRHIREKLAENTLDLSQVS